MNKKKFTPGPWKIPKKFDRADKEIYVDGNTSFGNLICVVDFDDVDHDEQEANAMLIASAPDMAAEIGRLRAIVNQLLEAAEIGKTCAEYIADNFFIDPDDPVEEQQQIFCNMRIDVLKIQAAIDAVKGVIDE